MWAYRRMVVRKGIVDSHVFEEPLDMLSEKSLNLIKVELRIDKESTDVCLHNIRKSLQFKVSLDINIAYKSVYLGR